MSSRKNTVVNLHTVPRTSGQHPRPAELVAFMEDGGLQVRETGGAEYACWWLQTGEREQVALVVGDRLLVVPAQGEGVGVALGRIGLYRAPAVQKSLVLEATEVMTLKCGEVSIDLRASDGKLMLRGEDVLLRAKGTQRIKAGSVSIN